MVLDMLTRACDTVMIMHEFLDDNDRLRLGTVCKSILANSDMQQLRYRCIHGVVERIYRPTTPFRIRKKETSLSPYVRVCSCSGCERKCVCCIDMRFDPPLVYHTSIPYCSLHMDMYFAGMLISIMNQF